MVFEVPENFPLLTKIPGTDIIGYDPDGNEIIACSVAVLDGLGHKEGVSIGDAYLEGGSCYLEFGEEAVIDYESDVKQYRTLVAILEKDYRGQSNPVRFTINITDVNEAPTITSTTTTFSAAENQTVIPGATITAIDVDAGDTLTFSVLSDVLTIDPETGVLSFKAGEAPDFETTTEVTATVTVTDAAGLFDTEEVTVTVTDVNDNPPVFADVNYDITIVENTKGPTLLETTDADADSTVTYSLSGADAADFEIVNNTLALKEAADFETKTSYAVTLQLLNDGVNSTDQAVTYTITDANDNAPVFADVNYDITIVENTKGPTLLETTDADAGSTVTYSLSGADAADFEIVNNTLALKEAADFETKTSYAVTVTATDNDGVNSTDQAVTYTITDANDNAPVFADVNYDITIVENTKGPTLLETTDADAGSTVTYSLSGADADDFEIVNNTLALKQDADFETKTSYAVTVTATDNDGVNSTDQAVTYTITDANDNAPVFKLMPIRCYRR